MQMTSYGFRFINFACDLNQVLPRMLKIHVFIPFDNHSTAYIPSIKQWSYLQEHATSLLTHKKLETHGCVLSTVVADVLVLKHQAIITHNAD